VKIGLFGGTFDPPHIGHLIVAQDAAETLGIDRLLFIPAGMPPHKRDRIISPVGVRLEMTRAAVSGDARFAVDERETRRPGPSFTVDTLQELRAELPMAELFLLIGADQYAELHTWHRAEEVRRLCRVAVLERAGAAVSGSGGGAEEHVPVTRIDVSASDIRARVAAGRPIRFLVVPAVEEIIGSHGLYR